MKFEDIKKLPPDLQLIAFELARHSGCLDAILMELRALNEELDALDEDVDDGVRIPEEPNA